jgi:predicted O-linked N-acetylglucosamine transferase (SPINDLY family)
MNNNIQKLAQQLLSFESYDELAKLLEQSLGKDKNQLWAYWDLGLVYLWQGKTEQAEHIWLSGITKIWEMGIKNGVEQLTAHLLNELERQEREKNNHKAWLLRNQLLSLNPEDWKNNLKLIKLSHILGKLTPEFLAEWDVVEGLAQANSEAIDKGLLLETVLIILTYPMVLSIDFLKASIPLLNGVDWLLPVMEVAEKMGTEKYYFTYASDIAKICWRSCPHDLSTICYFMDYYKLLGNETQLVEFSQFLYECRDTEERRTDLNCFIYSRLLLFLMQQSNWVEIEQKHLVQKLCLCLEALCQEEYIDLDSFITSRFWAICFPLLYTQDDPVINRRYLNRTADLFQQARIKLPQKLQSSLTSLDPKLIKRRLRIGYIGHTLRKHSVGWLSRWLFHYHDHSEFEVYLYLVAQNNDELTEQWILPNADKVTNFGRESREIATAIQADELDLLIDLDGLTSNTVAQVLALKPAPIQATWLGSDASGLPTVDYFFVDELVLPRDNQRYYREQLWYLPNTYIAVDGFEVGIPTVTRQTLGIAEDAVIYLTIQHSTKYTPLMAQMHLKTLQSVPEGILLIKNRNCSSRLRQMIQSLAVNMEITLERLIFLDGDADEATHRANLSIADIILDTYPYSGATTTLETLWMEIPLVTWVGKQFSARNSYAFMRQVGLTAGIAHNADEYVEWAIQLGNDRLLRQEIRQTLLEAKQTSPLWQGEVFTREMEAAYKKIIEGDDR